MLNKIELGKKTINVKSSPISGSLNLLAMSNIINTIKPCVYKNDILWWYLNGTMPESIVKPSKGDIGRRLKNNRTPLMLVE